MPKLLLLICRLFVLGPSGDHTTGSERGHFLFIETSTPRIADDVATIVLNLDEPWNGGCFSLYYHMLGPGVGELIVNAVDINQDAHNLFYLRGQQGAEWNLLSEPLPNLTTTVCCDYHVLWQRD